jgi:hypothetical protein
MKTTLSIVMPAVISNLGKIRKKAAISIRKNNGFGLNEFLGVAAAVIIAGFVIIPGLREFAELVIEELNNWWETVSSEIFQAS